MVHKRQGFTLLELLLASVITLLLLGLVAQGLRSSGDTSRYVQSSQTMLEELRFAGNLIGDYLSTAAFIYPVGVKLTLNTPESYTVRNPLTNNNTWTVGTDPIIAAILSPRDPGVKCSETMSSGPPRTGPQGCYRFMAVYPLRRGWVVQNASGAENPGPDPENNDKWALYIYERNLSGITALSEDTVIPTAIAGSSGNLLADYIKPGDGLTVGYEKCLDFDGKDIASLGPCGSSSRLDIFNSVARVSFALTGQVTMKGKSYTFPSPTQPLVFQVGARNLVIRK